jgi:APA family basic amino acid/polyamine antiporter
MNQLAGWGVTLAGALCLAGAFARLGARMPLAGGPYAYAHAASARPRASSPPGATGR